MKIILVNYRYFISGGPERYFFNIKEILEKNGHEVIPFSIKSSRNISNDYERYFLDIVDDDIYFSRGKKTPRMVIKSFARMFYSMEARRKMHKLLKEQKPDLVYIMQMHNKISPSIVDAARAENIPIIHRISDFQYMCPNALFYNERTGVCEECLKGHRFACVKNKCVLNSTVYSGIKMVSKWFHDVIKVHAKINHFIVPSEFTLMKLHEYGIPFEKLHHVPTFFNLKERNPQVEYKPFVLYVGRIERQKGLMTLVKAFEELPYELKIIGFSNDGYEDELKQYLGTPEINDVSEGEAFGRKGNIMFLGKKNFEEIIPFLRTCRCTVVPSEWYDNFPNAVLESYAYKKAVIATDFGSLKNMVVNNKTGLKFKYADIEDLRKCITSLMDNEENAHIMGENAYGLIETIYSPEAHYQTLIKLMEKAMMERN